MGDVIPFRRKTNKKQQAADRAKEQQAFNQALAKFRMQHGYDIVDLIMGRPEAVKQHEKEKRKLMLQYNDNPEDFL